MAVAQNCRRPMHYAAIESNRELNKSLKVIALLWLIFDPNMKKFFFDLCKTVNIFQEKYLFRKYDKKYGIFLTKNLKGWTVKPEILYEDKTDQS